VFTSDCPPDLDPDRRSPTLHRYHALLWGRTLPNGQPFELEDACPSGGYLRHRFGSGCNRWGSSDAVIQTLTGWRRPEVAHIVSQVARHERAQFYAVAYTIGGLMLFPDKQIDGRWTINQAQNDRHPLPRHRPDPQLQRQRPPRPHLNDLTISGHLGTGLGGASARSSTGRAVGGPTEGARTQLLRTRLFRHTGQRQPLGNAPEVALERLQPSLGSPFGGCSAR
jgi:hypothetical protein